MSALRELFAESVDTDTLHGDVLLPVETDPQPGTEPDAEPPAE